MTVVGERVLACRIDSAAVEAARVDWRAPARRRPTCGGRAPRAARGALPGATRRLGLRMAGLDLIVTPAGEPVFLELRRRAVGVDRGGDRLPIAAAIADELLAGARG